MQMVLAAFQEEQAEHCQAIGDILLDLERNPTTPQRKAMLDQLFREAHSLKGGARAAGLESVEQLAHRVEDIFSAVRAGSLVLTPDVCDPIYASLDAIGEMMSQIAAQQPVDSTLYTPLLETFGRILGEGTEQATPATASTTPPGEPAPPVPEPLPPGAPAAPTSEPPVAEVAPPAPKQQPQPATASEPATPSAPAGGGRSPAAESEEVPWETASTTVRLSTAALDNLLNETGELITCAVRSQQRARNAQELADPALRWRRLWRQVRPALNKLQESLPEFQPTIHHLNVTEAGHELLHESGRNGKQNIWRDAHAYPMLQTQVATLISTLTQANEIITRFEQNLNVHAREMAEDYSRLSAVTDRMHDQIRRTRMLPLATLFSPLRLQMREMTRAANKDIQLYLDDGGAEADRQVLERLREVLLHLLRNAIDHGIEPPDVRTAHGKPATGQIALRAIVSGDYLYLSVEDDGIGLDLNVICQRALDQGLISETELTRLSETELVDMIFAPGFSTRTTVSALSGRGVGLDIVRSQVERMHGRVTVQSTPGAGSIFTISVPLSLTSSHGLLLGIGQATYMIPLESVQRIVAVTPRDIQIIEGRAALIVDQRPIALMHLADLLGEVRSNAWHEGGKDSLNHSASAGNALAANGRSLALLLGSGERQVACMVDAVLGEQELVVHRLPVPIQRLRFIAGATILADGSVVPILDLVDVMRAAIGHRRIGAYNVEREGGHQRPTVLVVDDSITTRTLEKNILEAAGYQVHLATDGVEAMQLLEQLRENGGCDLLLSDVDMPRLNGFDLTTRVRSHTELKHLPIVLVTSLDKPTERERGISAGADAYIIKRSFDQQVLLDTIAQLI
jgi:two-component system chemotaxis sensor kinase CheA